MKRFISMLLILCMVMSMVPAYASAEEQDQQATVDTDDVTLEGTNSIGTMLVEEIQEEQEDQEEESSGGYVILGVTVEGSTATVSFDTMETAQLMVGLYSEDGVQLIASGKTMVTKDEHEAAVTIEGTVSQYFMVRVFLLDNYDYSPLCKSYTTPMYTQEMQNLLASTAEDYDQDRVLTLGEDTSTNFVVYHEDTLVIRPQDGVNTMSSANEETLTYVFDNADATLTGLQVGNVFAYEKTAADVLVIKVGTITVDGTTVTITGQDVELEEAFAYMKLEQGGDAGDMVQDESQSPDDGITFEGIEQESTVPTRGVGADITTSSSVGFTLEKDIITAGAGTVSVSGEFKFQTDIHLAFYISTTQRFVEFKVDTRLEGTFSVTAQLDLTLDLGVYAVNLYGVTVGFAPELHLTFSAKISLTAAVVTTVGFAYEKGAGVQNLSSGPKLEEPHFTFEGSVFLGIDLCPTVRLLEGSIAKIDIHIPFGIELKGELYRNPHYEDVEDYEGTIHHCDQCIEMVLYFKVAPKVELKFLNCDFFKVEWEIRNTRTKITDLYYAVDTSTFGVGTCPNKSYRVTVSVEDANNQAVSGAPVVYDEAPFSYDNSLGSTNSNGVVSTYMIPGLYTFRTQLNGTTYEYSHYIQQAGKVVLGPNVKKDRNFIAEKIDPSTLVDHGKEVKTGDCGDGVTYTLYESGHLWITGCGTMTNKSYYYQVPWYYEREQITKVVIGDEVENVCDYAFYDSPNLKEVYLGGNVKEIGYRAFYECAELKSINFPNKLEILGGYAFYCCDSLEEVTVPKSVTTMENGVFREMPNLKKVYFNAENVNSGVKYGQFFDDSGTESGGIEFIVGKDVTRVPDYMLGWGDSGTVDYVKLKSITFEEGSQCKEIGTYAFYCADSTCEVILPEGLEVIDQYAFNNTYFSAVHIPGTVTTIGKYAFSHSNGIETINIPASVTSMGDGVFYSCDLLKTVTFNGGVTVVPDSGFQDCVKLEEVNLSDGIVTITDDAFNNCESLKAISLPNTVTTVAESAFENCSSMETAKLSKSLTTIERYAFQHCSSLKEIVIPDSVTSIGKYAFAYNTAMTSFYLGSGVTSLTTDIILENHSLVKLEVSPDNTTFKSVGNCIIKKKQLFLGCGGSVIPSDGTVTSIGSYAFAYNDGLISITIPDKVTTVNTYAFYDCSGLEEVVLSNGMTKVDSYVFQYCSALKNITWGSKIKTIGTYAFRGCSALETVVLPNTVTSLGNSAFRECTALQGVTLSSALTSMGTYVFYECSALEQIVIPDSVTTIGSYTFRYCSGLQSVTFTGNAPTIGSNCFGGVTAKVYYPADNTTWTSSNMIAYGGTLEWTSYEPATKSVRSVMTVQSREEEIVPEETVAEVTEPVEETVVQTQPVTETVTEDVVESVTESETEAVVEGSSKPATRAVYPGNQESQVTDTNTIRTATFENLVPGQEYVMLALVSMETQDLLAADNVLYIYQAAADENGVLQVAYIQRVTTGLTYIMACGASYDDISAAQVEFPVMGADEELQAVDPVVTYEGQVLTEGEDYTVVGTVDYTAAGEYTCYIRGIYDYTGMITCTYTVRGDISTKHTDEWDRVTLCSDTQLELVLTNDLYLDLAGHDLTGTIITGEHNLYIMDSTTNEYSAANVGYLNCVDENGDPFVPQTTYAIDGAVAGENMQYLTLKTEDGYSFHRYVLEVTHMSLKPAHTAVGYKAQFCGDEMILAALDQTNALGFNMSLEGACEISRYMSTDRITAGKSISLRIQNYDVEGYGQAKLSVKARLQLADGTVVDSRAYAYSLQEMVEMVNEYHADYAADKLAALADMIEQYPIMQTWNVENILAA